MKIYFIRHGESEANFKRVYSGQTDTMLTEKGLKDAEGAQELLKGIAFDKIFASDLTRAMKTCEIAIPGCEYTKSPLIREIDVGSIAGKTVSQCKEELGEEFRKNSLIYNFFPYGGENNDMFKNRIRQFMTSLEGCNYEKVAVFCHGGVINTVLELVLGNIYEKNTVICENCSVNVFNYENNIWQLVAWNYTGKI